MLQSVWSEEKSLGDAPHEALQTVLAAGGSAADFTGPWAGLGEGKIL